MPDAHLESSRSSLSLAADLGRLDVVGSWDPKLFLRRDAVVGQASRTGTAVCPASAAVFANR